MNIINNINVRKNFNYLSLIILEHRLSLDTKTILNLVKVQHKVTGI